MDSFILCKKAKILLQNVALHLKKGNQGWYVGLKWKGWDSS